MLKPLICSVSDCEKYVKSRELCSAHVERFRKYGDPLIKLTNYNTGTAEQRFWKYVDKSGDCWFWTAGHNSEGYGAFNAGKGTRGAHIFSYQLAYGDIPKHLCVLHRCDNPPCVNPAHLFLGTKADNHADMLQKGRRVNHLGTANGQAKLNDEKVREIRQLHKQGFTQKAIAQMFNVSQYPVFSVIHHLNWTHVK